MKTWQSFLMGLGAGLISAALILVGNGRMEGKPILLSTPLDPPGVRVSVRGAVVAPGIYTLPPGSILQDALQAAGGALPRADTSRLNLAAPLSDGQDVRVPLITPTPLPGTPQPTPPGGGKINLNTATLAELESLPGIGPVLAQRIIDYRETNGPFQSVDDLLNVEGVGQSLLNKIRDLVEV
ncbi:MAG: ComEA family DNA-binding protein [Anaerolineales bacterium]|nr:ComEA family DNA-binding protein [Anaerolineales bacterium]